jgi:hypothetical protein
VHRVRDTAKPDFPKQLPGDQQRVLWVTRSPDTGFEECYNSSGRGKEGPLICCLIWDAIKVACYIYVKVVINMTISLLML